MRQLAFVLTVFLTITAARADALIVKTSPHSVTVTMDRLEAAVKKAGATVFARIDHAAGAASIDAALAPTQLLIFGNPKIGTPVMAVNGAAGLDLPLRVVVFQDKDGATRLGYHAAERLVEDHAIPADLPALTRMKGALNSLTNAAIAK